MLNAPDSVAVEWPLTKTAFLAKYDHPFLLVEHGVTEGMEYMTIVDGVMAQSSTELHPVRKRLNSPFSFITLGRANNNDVVIRDPSVSKSHLAFHEFAGGYQVTDMGSRNGTQLNDTALEPKVPTALADDDVLTLSRMVRVVFFLPETAFNWLLAHR